MSEKVAITIELEPELLKEFKRFSDAKHQSPEEAVRELMREFINKRRKTARQTAEAICSDSKGYTLGGISIRELRDEGRR
ncbi:ribbon-helix-helix domain-containing protein [Acidisoma silvae]|uniref:Uncharacterized protein n=1 Tax=Acidisoma silvae TaxID=2802396 RepID=A0A964E1P8_9PROT|nr:ribbon-helix-helix domain-containing protein [Acidisoma silvae]MCB8878477.1 hypothetical protein [Acidisoma silvae]